jgi:2-C-methyl-D-erythritol 2,4-cyclodiphosphate synthase
MRIGHGFDVHALEKGQPLILGGVTIPHHQGPIGHSDADVLIHAICDACLGAAGLGDIGKHFPDTADEYENIDSRILLRDIKDKVAKEGWVVANLDCTIIAQAPKMAPHLEQMRANLADDLGINTDQLNIKATTTEHLGYAGREEGIACHAVVLLNNK